MTTKKQQAEEEDKVVQKQKSGLEDHQLFDELYEELKENGEFQGLNFLKIKTMLGGGK